MFGRKTLIGFVLALGGCARPNYASSVAGGGSAGETTQSNVCQARFTKTGDCVNWQWELKPTDSEVGRFLFKVSRANLVDGSPVLTDGAADVGVLLWMPSMGHGSSPVKTERLDVGTYRASQVFFIMPGEWEIRFQRKVNQQIVEEAVIEILH